MILGCVCARGGSKGVPNKNLKHLRGQRLIGYTIEQAQESNAFDRLIVSTDSEEIADYARAWHVEVQIRPSELATDDASKWDVFRYLAEVNPCEILVDLDTGCPLRSPHDIIRTIAKLKEGYDVVVTAYESERNPYFNMVRVIGGVATIVNPTDWIITRRQDAPKVYSLSPSVFAIDKLALFRYNHWSRAHLGVLEIPLSRAHDIDTPDDWEYVSWLMERNENVRY